MSGRVCIHGHFYQPPRENAWTGKIDRQDSAAPFHDWNARIAAECYHPNAQARILDDHGLIGAIVNNYTRLSFDFGPTLLSWLEVHAPATYAAILAADHSGGGAMAQAYSHMILPLANRRDLATQVRWGRRDFIRRFGREPEGMWLPETAVNTATLEALASGGIAYTVLAPHQAGRIRRLGSPLWSAGAGLDTSAVYKVILPSGRTVGVFFYDGAIAHDVAFGGLLRDGERLAGRLRAALRPGASADELIHFATDGESYGHHHRFGEMALAAALLSLERNPGVTNYNRYWAAHAPTYEVEVVENSSWSCVHGVERWRADCGCNSGGKPGWRQHWRAPLRVALDGLRDRLAVAFEFEAGPLLVDPWAARNDYIEVVLAPANAVEFLDRHARGWMSPPDRARALRLLEMQRCAQLMYTSCGWFFDEVSGIETTQILQYAARAMDLAQETCGLDLRRGFLDRLAEAPSNLPEFNTARAVYEVMVEGARAHALGQALDAVSAPASLAEWLRAARDAQASPAPVNFWNSQNQFAALQLDAAGEAIEPLRRLGSALGFRG